jgi:hypothetical protein
MSADDSGKRGGLLRPAVATDVVVTHVERRMVNKQQRRLIRLFAQDPGEPRLPLRAKSSLPLTRRRRIDRHQAYRVFLDRVVKKVTAIGKLRVVAECGAHRVLVIAIAGHQVERRFQRCQQLSKQRILLRRTVLRRIPGKQSARRLAAG